MYEYIYTEQHAAVSPHAFIDHIAIEKTAKNADTMHFEEGIVA